MRTGAELIAEERARQIEEEGYTVDHDLEYGDDSLAKAAACYAYAAANPESRELGPPNLWPWDAAHWKPTTPIRDLTKSGALIAAEIDRRLRAAQWERTQEEG